jgi:hypothetical protein
VAYTAPIVDGDHDITVRGEELTVEVEAVVIPAIPAEPPSPVITM